MKCCGTLSPPRAWDTRTAKNADTYLVGVINLINPKFTTSTTNGTTSESGTSQHQRLADIANWCGSGRAIAIASWAEVRNYSAQALIAGDVFPRLHRLEIPLPPPFRTRFTPCLPLVFGAQLSLSQKGRLGLATLDTSQSMINQCVTTHTTCQVSEKQEKQFR